MSPKGVLDTFDDICNRSVVNKDQWIWRVGLDTQIHLVEHPKAAELVASGEIQGFHVLAQGITINDIVLPDLGVFVQTNEIVLDYRMGSDWGESQLLALFELLRQLLSISPGSHLYLGDTTMPEVNKLFVDVYSEFSRGISQ